MTDEKSAGDALFNAETWNCPLPLRDSPRIIMGHGGGGKLSRELVEHLFLPEFQSNPPSCLDDSTVLEIGDQRLAFSTDSFVVRPLFFPGGSIGHLAVNGTVNDLAMSGARPLYLTAGFILEEGFSLESLARIVRHMSVAARSAGVRIVTGDTKVVERGHGDGCYINTSGIGVIPSNVEISASRARPGDVILVNGTMGDHGMAIMSLREGLEFEAEIQSDCASLAGLVAAMLEVTTDIRTLRDPTRGGLATSLNEVAVTAKAGIVIDETAVPIHPVVQSACEILGLDPFFVANEGKLIAIVAPDVANQTLHAMRQHPLGRASQRIGVVTGDHPGIVVARTAIGATRVISMQVGEQLPRIC